MFRWIFLSLFIICSFLSCDSDKNKKDCVTPTQAKGFTLSPVGFPVTYNRTAEFFNEMERYGDAAVMWNGPWRDDIALGTDAGTTPAKATLVQESSYQYCFVPVPVFEWRHDGQNIIQIPENTVNDWSNFEARDKFIEMLKAFVNLYRPPYVFLGNENDFYYETNTADYRNWLLAYSLVYDAIKQVNPETLVGPVFSYEHISGQGTLKNWNAQYWSAYDDMDPDRVDIVGFTVFPFFQFGKPEDIPANYLDGIFDRVGNRPVIITATGWPAEYLGDFTPVWEPRMESQVKYVSILKSLVASRNIPVMNWLYYNGMVDDGTQTDYWEIFGSVSLLDSLGNQYLVLDDWVNL